MKPVFKWLARGLAVLVLVGGLAGIIGYAALWSSLPRANGAASIAGLAGEVEILRDGNGVPHIEAASHQDAVRALGFAHAQDRLWQMHVLRMVAQGRLSELFGPATVETDIFLRTIDLAGVSQKSFEALSSDAQTLLRAYAEGVNGWLALDPGFLRVKLPPEFIILGKTMAVWEPWQSIAILKVMALTLDTNLSDEIRRLALSARGMNPREINDLMPYGPRDNPPPLPDLRNLYLHGQSARNPVATDDGGKSHAFDLAWKTGISASNNWVVAGERTESGKPLLANDPHLGLQTPTIFYLAHMAFAHGGENRHLVGGTLPGTPFVLSGRNDRLAWGLTTTKLDSQDLYVERVKGDDPGQYQTPGGWAPFEQEEITIEVDGAPSVSFIRRRTRHGPVLPDDYQGLSKLLPPGHVGALQWVSLAEDDTTAEGVMNINRSRAVDEFMDATRKIVAPMQSIVVADVEGNIGLIAPARVPLRSKDNLVMGRAPVPGWLEKYDWLGWLAHDDLPRLVNPGTGALATANANWLPPGYEPHITYDWDEHFRQARAEAEVIGFDRPHSPDSMKRIQSDDFSPALTEFRREALARLEAGAGQDERIIDSLRNWDGRMTPDSAQALILTAWWRQTAIALFEDDLGSDYSRFAEGHLRPVIDALTMAGARDWCDNRKTDRNESCGIILAQSLSAALSELREANGSDWRNWRWGSAHRSIGEHRPFSSVDLLSGFFTVAPESAGGSYTLLRGRTDFGEPEPYRNVQASVLRAWYDLSNLDNSEYVTSTGQSGHFLSDHYDDLADDWAQSGYITIPTDRNVYGQGRPGQWTLKPES